MYSNQELTTASSGVRGAVFLLASRILRPLVKIFVRYGFSCQEFTETLRWTYVDVAMNDPEFMLPSRSRQFKSRAAVLTGLSRKEILRLMEYRNPPGTDNVPQYNRAARVLHGWLTDAKYQDESGTPLTLPTKGDEPSFSSLVKTYSGDVPPRAVLDELRRNGVVDSPHPGQLRLLRHEHHAPHGSAEELQVAAACAGDLIDTLEFNLRPGVSRRLQREVFSTQISEAVAGQVSEHLQVRADSFAREVNDYLLQHEDSGGGPRVRMGVGVYRFGA